MYVTEQVRIKKDKSYVTRVKISVALEELLELRCSNITIAKIMEQAKMSRLTFYNYFQNIDELVHFTDLNHRDYATEFFNYTKSLKLVLVATLHVFADHKRFYKYALALNGPAAFEKSYHAALVNNSILFIGEKHITDDILFALEVYWYGYVRIITNWILNGMTESPELLADRFDKALPAILVPFYHSAS